MMNDALDVSEGRRSSPIKRIRQACVNCRRKKSRCGGEKPVCSICKRLEQACVYDSPQNRGHRTTRSSVVNGEEFSRRFGSIEQRLEYLAATVEKAVPAATTSRAFSPRADNGDFQPPHHTTPTEPLGFTLSNSQSERSGVPRYVIGTSTQDIFGGFGLDSVPQDIVQDGVETYFNAFHGQPYALFIRTADIQPLSPVILNPMLALSIRCSSHPFWSNESILQSTIGSLSERSWQDLLRHYGEGATDLEYLQAICLLAQVDFSDGRVRRAQTQISLGIRITQSLGYLKSSDLGEEYRRCVWTFFMLDRTFSVSRTITPALHYNQFQLPLPTSDEGFLGSQQPRGSGLGGRPESESLDSDIGINAINVKVFSIWNDVLQYVFRSPPKSNSPPWQADSDLADIESQFTDFEPDFASHRYHRVHFPRRAQDEPSSRPYFNAWLCFQLLYMSIQCVVHHPFIMFIKMQPLIRNRKVPPSFLQKSYKSSLIHSRWVIRLIEEMEDAGLMLYDPFIGYLVAIAATIQLEHTVSKHSDVAASAKLSVKGAIRYLRKLSKYWRSTENLLQIVEELATRLRNRSTIYYSQDDYNGILPSIESQRVQLAGIDIDLMWSVFDYASISTAEVAPKPLSVIEKAPAEGNPYVASNSGRQQLLAERNPPGPSADALPQPSDAPPSGTDSTLFDPDAFSDLPEEWILDDWTLFGAPLSAYHSGFGG